MLSYQENRSFILTYALRVEYTERWLWFEQLYARAEQEVKAGELLTSVWPSLYSLRLRTCDSWR